VMRRVILSWQAQPSYIDAGASLLLLSSQTD
jgi:hypothetical protein